MARRSISVFCLIVLSGISALSQTRSVTNDDLERYKQSRLKAAREYRENYASLGLPSPEELDRLREQSRVETEALSAKLRAQRIEQERIEMEQQAAVQTEVPYYVYVPIPPGDPYYSSFYSSGFGRRYRSPIRLPYQQPGYFAGGQFWPTGGRTPSRPLIRPVRH